MKRYQAVAFLLSTAMTVSSVAPVFGASNDVFGHWAELTITKWQNEGRIGGYEDGTFKPDKAITRAEFVRLLNSAAPTAFTASTSINFSDVKESDWFYADVAKAVGGRVASGFEDGTFRPGETVTRMQAAVFICNAKGLTPNEAAANNFTDAASIPAWAKGAVGAAVAAGYLSGYPDGSFGGSKGMTRAEAVSTLDRVLGGGSTTTTTPSGEIDTSDRDNSNTEDNRTAEAGNMVWTSGGGGGSSKKSSSSSSSSSDKKTHNVTIRSQKEANDYEGKTLTGTTSIYVDGSGIDLKDIRFKGDVDIYADDTATAAAYIGEDTAVAAANSTVDIYFEGKTNVSGTITVIRNTVAGADKVVIKTRTPRALSASVLAKVATKIVGFELSRVEAQAPVEIAEGAKVNTVEAGDNASVEVAADASVDKVDVTGDAKDIVLNGEGSTDVTVKNGASADQIVVDSTEATVELEGSAKVNDVYVVGDGEAAVKVNDNAKVENVQVSDSASADVAVADKAAIGTVKLSDTATAKVDVAPEAKVDTISSTSTGKTEVSGEGTVDKIEATNPSTVDTSNAGENIPTVDKKDETTTTPTPATKTITAAQLKDVALTTPTAATEKASVTGLPTGVKQEGTTWTATTASTPAAQADGDTTTTPGGDDTTTTPGGDDTTTTPGGDDTTTTPGGDDTTTTPTKKAHTATITLTADTGYVFDTTIDKTAFTGLGTAVTDAKTTASTITLTVTADITDSGTTDPDDPTPPVTEKVPASVTIGSVGTELNHKTTTTFKATVKATDNTDMADTDYASIKWELLDESGAPLSNDKISINATTGELTVGELAENTTIKVKVTVTGKDKDATKVENTTAAITIKAEDPVITGLKLVKPTNFPTAALEEETEITFTKENVKGVVGSSEVSLPDTATLTFAIKVVNKTDGANNAEIADSNADKYATFDAATGKLTVKAIASNDTVKQVEISITAKADAGADGAEVTTAEPLTITARQAAVATAVKITAPTEKTISVEQGATYATAFAAECVDQYGETIATPTGQKISFAVTKASGTVVSGTEIDTDNKLTIAATEPEGTEVLTVTATCGDLTEDTRKVTVTKKSTTPTGDADFDDTKNTNTAINLTSTNLTTGRNVTLATTGITDINGTGDKAVKATFQKYEKESTADTTVDGSKLEVTAAVENKTLVKVTAKQNGQDVPVAGTYTYEVEIPIGGATINADGDTNTAAIKTNITVVVDDGNGGGGNEITTVDALTVTVPVGATEVPDSTELVAASANKGYTATLDWKATENNDKFVTVESKKYFKAGETYKATITLTPEGEKTFNTVQKVSVTVGSAAAADVNLTADTENNKALTGTVDVTIADGTATVAADGEGVKGTQGAAVTGTVTITLTGDAFKQIAEDGDLSSLFEFITLPNNLTPKVNAAVTEGAKTAVIKFDGNLAADATTINDISVKIKADALLSGKADGISPTDKFTITVTSSGSGDEPSEPDGPVEP